MATITGTQGDDTLIGTAAADSISAGAGNDVVRLSIGLEDKADIIADLEQALAKV